MARWKWEGWGSWRDARERDRQRERDKSFGGGIFGAGCGGGDRVDGTCWKAQRMIGDGVEGGGT